MNSLTIRASVLHFVLAALLWSQTAVDLRTQAKSVDFSSAISTKPSKTGTILPSACTVGETFFKLDALPGRNLYGCVATNTWTLLSSSYIAGSGILIAGSSVSVDDAVNPFYYRGDGAPTLNCTPGRDYYVDQTAGVQYYCGGVNVWKALSEQTHTHAAAAITQGMLPLVRGGTNQTTWLAGRCVQVSSDGTRLESAAADCSTGGAGGITSVNGDTTASQVIEGEDGLRVTTQAGRTAIGQAGSSPGDFRLLPWDYITGTVNTTIGAAGRVYLWRFYQPRPLTIKTIVFYVNTGEANASCLIGIYNRDGSAKIVDSGPIDASSAGTKVVTLPLEADLRAGAYLLAWGCSSSTVQYRAVSASAEQSVTNGGGTVLLGHAANTMSGQSLPASTGAVNSSSPLPVPVMKLVH